MSFKSIVTICMISNLCSAPLYAGAIISEIPSEPDISSKYLFYLHGSVEEDEGSTEKYETAIEAIADYSDIVITEVRGDTDPNTYAEKLKTQVNALINKGIPAKNITISGFSKGSIITLAAAGAIQIPGINYVLLAGCSGYLNDKYNVDTKNMAGRILSIYDSEDEKFGSCSGIISSSDSVVFEETEIDSGKGHKLFRIPKEKFIEQWRDPLVSWADV
jgi:hypothetical protein